MVRMCLAQSRWESFWHSCSVMGGAAPPPQPQPLPMLTLVLVQVQGLLGGAARLERPPKPQPKEVCPWFIAWVKSSVSSLRGESFFSGDIWSSRPLQRLGGGFRDAVSGGSRAGKSRLGLLWLWVKNMYQNGALVKLNQTPTPAVCRSSGFF